MTTDSAVDSDEWFDPNSESDFDDTMNSGKDLNDKNM